MLKTVLRIAISINSPYFFENQKSSTQSIEKLHILEDEEGKVVLN